MQERHIPIMEVVWIFLRPDPLSLLLGTLLTLLVLSCQAPAWPHHTFLVLLRCTSKTTLKQHQLKSLLHCSVLLLVVSLVVLVLDLPTKICIGLMVPVPPLPLPLPHVQPPVWRQQLALPQRQQQQQQQQQGDQRRAQQLQQLAPQGYLQETKAVPAPLLPASTKLAPLGLRELLLSTRGAIIFTVTVELSSPG
jgi:hypothetical protein